MTYFGEGPPDWWLERNPPVPREPTVRKRARPEPPPSSPSCECGRDYLEVPLDGPSAPCPNERPA